MAVMFSMIMITGNLTLRSQSFKSNPLVLSFSSAFSGGLFLAVGLLHILPEANGNISNVLTDDSGNEPYLWSLFITVMSFSLILFIQKVATNHQHHYQPHNDEVQLPGISNSDEKAPTITKEEGQQIHTKNEYVEQIIRDNLNKNSMMTNKLSEQSKGGEEHLTPFILQVAIGIHAVFEGLAIGIEQEPVKALSITLAVVCHKWAEGLTLGIAFNKSSVNLNMSTIMIALQAIMNPIGVGIGWILSNQGKIITGIFLSISAGTFIYIATMEILVEEFNVMNYKLLKFGFFLVSIGFVTSIWFIEQSTGG